MVHALQRLHRVLIPDGVLIDLRPAIMYRRVSISRGKRPIHLGELDDDFTLDYAADAAMERVARRNMFHLEHRERIVVRRYFDSTKGLVEYIEDSIVPVIPPDLLDRIAQERKRARSRARIVVTRRLDLAVWRRQ